jgi:hypothetical protein
VLSIMESQSSLIALSAPQCEVDHIHEVIEVTARTRMESSPRDCLAVPYAAADPHRY